MGLGAIALDPSGHGEPPDWAESGGQQRRFTPRRRRPCLVRGIPEMKTLAGHLTQDDAGDLWAGAGGVLAHQSRIFLR